MCVMRTADLVVLTDCPPGPEEQKVSIASVAKKMGVSKVTVYRMLEKEHLPSERLVQFGELLRHDFFQYFTIDL